MSFNGASFMGFCKKKSECLRKHAFYKHFVMQHSQLIFPFETFGRHFYLELLFLGSAWGKGN